MQEGNTIAEIEGRFLRSESAVGGIPIYQLWGTILEHCPGARRRHLWDDELNEVFERAYETASGRELWATCELAGLRWRFFDLLQFNRVGLTHVNEYESTAAIVWYTKLLDRQRDSAPYRRTRRNAFIRPPEVSRPSKHEWVH
jgi:hypothetical protein